MPYPFFCVRSEAIASASEDLIDKFEKLSPSRTAVWAISGRIPDNVAFTPSIPSDSIKVKSCWATIVSIMATPDKSMYSRVMRFSEHWCDRIL